MNENPDKSPAQAREQGTEELFDRDADPYLRRDARPEDPGKSASVENSEELFRQNIQEGSRGEQEIAHSLERQSPVVGELDLTDDSGLSERDERIVKRGEGVEPITPMEVAPGQSGTEFSFSDQDLQIQPTVQNRSAPEAEQAVRETRGTGDVSNNTGETAEERIVVEEPAAPAMAVVEDDPSVQLGESEDDEEVQLAPDDLVLSNHSVDEHSQAGKVVATLEGHDPNSNDSLTYSIVGDSSNIFILDDNKLVLKEGVEIDFEEAARYDVILAVTDSAGNQFTKTFTIDINDLNDAPVIGDDVLTQLDEDSGELSGVLAASDQDMDAVLTFSISDGSTAPAGFTLNPDGSYNFDPTDSAYDHLSVGDSTVLTIPVTVTDDPGATDTAQIRITVIGTNDAPVASADVTTSVDEGAATISGQLTSTDLDDGATAAFSISEGSSVPAGFTLNSDGSYSFDPTDSAYDHLNVGDSAVLTIPVTVADDQGGTDTVQIRITVNGTNDAPMAGADVTTSVDEGSAAITGQLTSTDLDDNATSSFSISEGSDAPAGFSLNGDGSYSFDPTDSAYDHLNVDDSTVLTIPVTVTDDQGGTGITQIRITVNGTNDAPVAGADVTATMDEGSAAVSGQLTSTDLDDNATATFSISEGSSAPAGFSLSEDGSYSFDPTDSAYDHLNVGDSAVLTIPVTVADDQGGTDTAQIRITVNGTNDAPVAGADVTNSVDEGAASISGQLTSTDLDDNATVTFSVSEGSEAPAGFSLNSDGSYNFDPTGSTYDHLNAGDSAVLTIPVTVTDDQGGTDTAQIRITVNGTNDAPVAGADVTTSVDEGAASISGQLTSTDLDDNATASFSISEGSDAPAGFSLNPDGSYSFDPTDSAYDHLNVGDSTVLTIPVTVADDPGATDTAQIRITVIGTNDAPVASADVTTSVDEGAATISGQLTSTDLDDGATAAFSISEGSSVPAGFTLNSDGSYSFEPTDSAYDHLNVGDSAVLTIPVTVTDDQGATDTAQIRVTVNGTNNSPVAGADVTTSVDEDTASIIGQLTSSDLDDNASATFTVSEGSTAPAGFSLTLDGSYEFNPTDSAYDHLNVGDSAVLTIPVTVADDQGGTDTAQIRITVNGTNDAPVVGADVTTSVDEDSVMISGQLTSTDLDDDATASFSISEGSSAPAGFSLSEDGSYSFDPTDSAYDHLNVGDSAVLTIPVTVADDQGGTDTAQIRITVNGTNDAPVAGADVTTSVDEGAASISGQLTSTDLDDNATVAFSISEGSDSPAGFSLNPDGSYSFDPTDSAYDHLNVGDSAVLTIPVTVTDDQGGTDTAQIRITVNGTNDAPVAGADVTTSVDEGAASISGQLTSTDLDDNATVAFSISEGSDSPAGFSLNPDGSYSFDPTDSAYDHLNVGDSAVLTIPVTVTDDQGGTDTAQIRITVNGTNDAPVAGADVTTSVDEGAASISGQLTSTDLDDNATVAFSISEGSDSPAGFSLNPDGSYSFDPTDSAYDHLNVGDSAVLTIPVTVTDDQGGTDTAQIRITVNGTNDAPVAGADVTTSVDEGAASISGQLTSTDLDDNATVAFSISEGSDSPAGFSLNPDGSYSFDPTDSAYDHLNVGDSAVLTIPVTVTDDQGGTDTAQIRITVNGTNDAPVVGADVTTSVDEDAASISGQLTSTDLDDNATATFSISEGSETPAGFSLNEDGSYSFDPTDSAYDHLNVGDSAVLTIPVTVADDQGGTDTAQIRIAVNGTNDAPVVGADVTTSVDEGSAAISGQLTSSDLDDNATASFSISEGSDAPAGFSLNEDGSYSFDPTDSAYDHLNVGDSAVLTIPVTVADDQGGTDTVQIRIAVNGTNGAPVAGADVTTSVDEDAASISGQLTSTDLDDNATATFSISEGNNAPAGFELHEDGSYEFNPTDDAYDHLNVGDSAVLTIPVTVADDQGGTDTVQIRITVNGTNGAPVAGADVTTSVDEDAASISGQLTSTDLDDNATATFSISEGNNAPAGFELHEDGSYEFNPTDDAYDHLNVGDSAVLTIPVTVADDQGGTDTVQIRITVNGTNGAPVAGADVTTSVDEDAASISGQLTSTDLDDNATATFSISEGNNAPAGFELHEDGSYEFNPTDDAYDHLNVGDSAVLTIPVTVTDDQGRTDTAQIRITVNGTNDAPMAGADATATMDEGSTAISGQLTSTDLDDNATATFSISEGSEAPAGFSLNEDGSYSFDPTDSAYDHLNVGDSAVLTIPVTVTDDQGRTDTAQIRITVDGTNDAPMAGADATATMDESSTAISGQLTSTDLDDGATAAFSISEGSSAPAGFSLNEDGSYSFDPTDSAYDHLNVGDSAVLTIPVTVTDDQGGTDTAQIRITLNGTNDAPVAGADVTTSVDEDAATILGQLTSNDLDGNATASFSISEGSDAPAGFSLNEDGSYSFDPTDSAYDHLNVDDSTVLTIPVTVTDDQGATDTAQIRITVSGTNDAPVAGADVTTSVNEGSAAISGQLTSTDLDDSASATFTVSKGSTAPAGFTLNMDGSYSFDPADSAYDHFNVGDSAVLTIPVTVTDDQGGTDTAQIRITVNGTNDAPVAGADVTTSVDEGSAAISGQLTSTDLDDNATATFSISKGNNVPAGFELHEDGSYEFNPTDDAYDHLNVGDSAVLTIPVTVTDDQGGTDTAQIRITVNGTNDAPVAGADVTTSVDEDAATILGQLTSNDLDDNATASFSISEGSDAPAGFSLNEDGSYSFDPTDSAYDHLNVDDSTVLTIPVTVTDDQGGTDTAQIRITVNGTNDAPVAGTDVTTSVDEDAASISGQLTSSDLDDNATASFSISEGSDAPAGFSLNEDGPYSFDPTDRAYDHLNVGDSAVLTIPVTVTDDQGGTDTAQIRITVNGTNDGPVAGTDVTATMDEGSTAISGQLTSTDLDDGATAAFSISEGSSVAAGFSLNEDGSYSFDPTDSAYDHLNVGDSAVLTIPVTVTDDQGGTDTAQIRITVNGTNDAPVAGADVTTSVSEGASAITGQLTSTDQDDGATAAFSISEGSSAPAGFSLNGDGSYSFDPTDSAYDHLNVGDSAVLTIPVIVTDDQGATDTAQIRITVNGTNDAPVAGADVTTSVDEDAASISGQLTSTDLDDNATVTFSISEGSDAPAGFSLNEDGSYSFDPTDSAYDHLNVGDSAVLTIPVTVADDQGGTDTVQIRITVNGTNDAPVAGTDVTTSVDEDAASISGQLTSTDLDGGATAAFSISEGSSSPAGFSLNGDGSYSFDPTDSAYDHLNVGDSAVLTIPVTVADDQGGTDTVQIRITVNGTNDAPVAGTDVTTSVDEDAASISGQLTSTDLDGGATAAFSISEGSSSPAGFSLNGDGSYSFDPTDSAYDHLNVGDSAVLTIPVIVTDDQGGTDTAQIRITVNGTNDAPVVGADVTTSVDEGAASISGQLTSTDLDDNATVTFSVSEGSEVPAGFTLNPDGSYSFDPTDSAYDHLNVDDSTVLTIPVTVTDDQGGTDTAQIRITVNGTNDAPVVGADVTTSVDEGAASISGQLTSTDLDDNATATFSISEGSEAPAGFSLNEDGSYSFDPTDSAYDHLNVGDSAVLTIPVTVTDDQGRTDTAQIRITVDGTNDAPMAGADATATMDEGSTAISGQLTSTDLDDGATAAFSISEGSSAPAGFSLNEDGSYSFDPTDSAYDHLNVGDSAVLTIPVTVTDDQGGTDTAQIRITLNGTSDAPTAITISNSFINEDTAGGSVVADLSAVDADFGDTFTYRLTDDADGRFVIDGDQIKVADGVTLNHEDISSHDVTIEVQDASGSTFSRTVTIDVADVNEAPVDIVFSDNSLDENAEAGTVVANLSATDEDEGEVFSYALTDDPSGNFEIVGNQIRVKEGAVIDYEDSSEHNLMVQVTDSDGNSFTETVTIDVRDVDERPAGIVLIGTNNADQLVGGAGDDTFYGKGANDRLEGGEGDDTFRVDYDAGLDQITGGEGYDTVQGGSRNDTIRVSDGLSNLNGVEEIDGGTGWNQVVGTGGDDTLDFNADDAPTLENINRINGGRGNDTIINDDTGRELYGDAGNDTIIGGAGDDVFRVDYDAGLDQMTGGEGYDTVQGGSRNDTIRVSDGLSNLNGVEEIDGGTGWNQVVGTGGDDTLDFNADDAPTLENINRINGGRGNDTIINDDTGRELYGDAGNDTIIGGAGDDVFRVDYDAGLDQMTGGEGYDTVQGGSRNDTIRVSDGLSNLNGVEEIDGGTGWNQVVGTGGDDTLDFNADDAPTLENINRINGGRGNDTIINDDTGRELYGDAGNDTIIGGAGDDVFRVDYDAGLDQMTGGEGYDTVQGGSRNDTIRVSDGLSNLNGVEEIDGGTGWNQVVGTGGGDTLDFSADDAPTLENINRINGGRGNDTIINDDTGRELYGDAGNDTIIGGAGDDVFRVDYDAGLDQITGGEGYDTVQGGSRNDTIRVSDGLSNLNGVEEIDGGTGWNQVVGTGGDDTLDFSADDAPTLENINRINGGRGNDTIINDDTGRELYGDAGNDILQGGAGNDVLDGGTGNDTLIYKIGEGNDTFDGGSGTDTLRIEVTSSQLNADAGLADMITQLANELPGHSGSYESELGITATHIEQVEVYLDGHSVTLDEISANTPTLSLKVGDPDIIRPANDEDNPTYSYDLNLQIGDTSASITSITFGDLPEGAQLSAGTDNGDGSWTLNESQLSGLQIIVSETVDIDFYLQTSVEFENNGLIKTAVTSDNIDVINADGETIYGTSGDDSIGLDTGSDLSRQSRDSHQSQLSDDSQNVDIAPAVAGDGDDLIVAGAGEDKVKAGDGDDVIFGETGKDDLKGGKGADQLFGGEGNDKLKGEDGDDILKGGAGNDELKGGKGDDQLYGGAGDDVTKGEAGDDTYFFNPFDGNDIFHGGEGGGWTDAIHLDATADPNADPNNPWTIEVDGQLMEYDLATHALELNPDTAGVVTLADGSELAFDGIERIEW